MNVRKGIIRIWVVASICWFFGYIIYHKDELHKLHWHWQYHHYQPKKLYAVIPANRHTIEFRIPYKRFGHEPYLIGNYQAEAELLKIPEHKIMSYDDYRKITGSFVVPKDVKKFEKTARKIKELTDLGQMKKNSHEHAVRSVLKHISTIIVVPPVFLLVFAMILGLLLTTYKWIKEGFTS
jgi:hypothetical protein